MKAIKARFDGKQVILPAELKNLPPSEIILVYPNEESPTRAWAKVSESAFAKAWDNDTDAVYDAI